MPASFRLSCAFLRPRSSPTVAKRKLRVLLVTIRMRVRSFEAAANNVSRRARVRVCSLSRRRLRASFATAPICARPFLGGFSFACAARLAPCSSRQLSSVTTALHNHAPVSTTLAAAVAATAAATAAAAAAVAPPNETATTTREASRDFAKRPSTSRSQWIDSRFIRYANESADFGLFAYCQIAQVFRLESRWRSFSCRPALSAFMTAI